MKSTIVGPDGQPLEKDLLTRDIADAQLTGMRSIWGYGSIANWLTPVHLADVLQRAALGDHHDFLTLAEEMEERDLHYGGQLATRKRAVSSIDAEVITADDSPQAVRIADEVRSALTERPDFADIVEGCLDGLGKGYSATEIVWDHSARQWWPQRFEWRDPRFFRYDEVSGRQLLLITDEEPMGRALPAYKFIVHQPRIKSGIPLRGALARLAAVAYLCKSVALADWMTFAELFGMPIRVGKYHSNATAEEKASLRRAVANIGSDAAAIMPEQMQLELIEVARSAGGESLYPTLCEWLDKQVSKGVLGQTMTADDGASQAQANVHNDVRLDIQKADCRQLAAAINRDLVKPFVDVNFGPQQHYPQVQFPVTEPEDIKALTDALERLVPMGLQVPAGVMREKLGLPEPQDDEAVLQAPGAAPTLPPADGGTNTALNRQDTTVDDLEDFAGDWQEWEPQMRPLLQPILDLADRSDNEQAFIEQLPGLVAEMNDDAFTKRLALSLFKARGLGDASDD